MLRGKEQAGQGWWGGVLLAGLVKGCLYPGVWARCLVETVENLLWHR